MPGVLSARWAGRGADDAANLRLLLEQTADVPDERRGAAFVCAAALVTPDGREQVVEGRLAGVLRRDAAGDATASATTRSSCRTARRGPPRRWTPAEKDAISHRGRAFRALAPLVADALGS